jgi:hypothetical protein
LDADFEITLGVGKKPAEEQSSKMDTPESRPETKTNTTADVDDILDNAAEIKLV